MTLLVLAAVLLLLVLLVFGLRGAVAESRIGTVIDLIKDADLASQLTPRSVSGGDSIFLPLILKDFPEFDVELARGQIENEIRAIFSYINGTGDFPPPAVLEFARMLSQELRQDAPLVDTIHRTAISDYVKAKDSASIMFQTAFAYSVLGKNDAREIRQERFTTQYTYFLQDTALEQGQSGVSLRCSYCGAPLVLTGNKVCEYCSNEIIVAQDRAWQIIEINRK